MRRQTGTSMVYSGQTSPISRTVSRMADKVRAEESKKALDERRAKAARPTSTVGQRVRFTDEEVAEMRRLHQREAKTCKELAELYECDKRWMHQVLTYAIRSRYLYA